MRYKTFKVLGSIEGFDYESCIFFVSPVANNIQFMSQICQITGKKAMVGNNVSHANNKRKRIFLPNLQVKRFFLPEEKRWITLKVSSQGLKLINKNGLTACIKEAREEGWIPRQ